MATLVPAGDCVSFNPLGERPTGENCCVETAPSVLPVPGSILKMFTPSWLRAVRSISANFTSINTSPVLGGVGTSSRLRAFVETALAISSILSATACEEACPDNTTTSFAASTFTCSSGKDCLISWFNASTSKSTKTSNVWL